MSDPQVPNPETPIGDPIDDRPVVDDVVGSANAGLADAEAARDSVAGDDRTATDDEPVFSDAPASGEPYSSAEPYAAAEHNAAAEHHAAAGPGADHDSTPGTPSQERPASAPYVAAEPVVSPDAQTTAYATSAPVGDDVPWYDRPDATADAANASAAAAALGAGAAAGAAAGTAAASTPAAAGTVAASTPVASAPLETAYAPISPAAMQPIFVQAPEAPRPRGNRAAAGAIGILAAVVFAALYLGAWLGFGMIKGDITLENIGESALSALTTFTLWVPTVVFFVAFWLLGGIINRGRWGHWVIFGLFVGIASYAGHILGALFQAPFWMLTAREGAALVETELLAPLAIAAFVIGRELTIWFGAWVSARGKRMTELNTESQREYERTLEAGPQLVQQ